MKHDKEWDFYEEPPLIEKILIKTIQVISCGAAMVILYTLTVIILSL